MKRRKWEDERKRNRREEEILKRTGTGKELGRETEAKQKKKVASFRKAKHKK